MYYMTEAEQTKRKRIEEDYYLAEKLDLPDTDEEADIRYKEFMGKDPYPDIEPALLNSADLFKYVAKTGMIWPFYISNFKGASYEVRLKGKVIWWDGEKKEHTTELKDPTDYFKLEPNSIAFVTLEPKFRIPDYMALRFNLKIIHVYKGLLLGTGPLVDPGFVGRLSIPLHNLTANTYTFHADDEMIQMEFTKLSRNSAWDPTLSVSSGLYKRNWIKPCRELKDYISRAAEGNDSIVRSSIPDAIQRGVDAAQKASDIAKDSKDQMENFRDESKKQQKDFEESTIGNIEKQIKMTQVFNVAVILTIAAFACSTLYQLGTVNSVKKEQIYELEQKYEQSKAANDDIIRQLEDRIRELEEQQKDKETVKEEEDVIGQKD